MSREEQVEVADAAPPHAFEIARRSTFADGSVLILRRTRAACGCTFTAQAVIAARQAAEVEVRQLGELERKMARALESHAVGGCPQFIGGRR